MLNERQSVVVRSVIVRVPIALHTVPFRPTGSALIPVLWTRSHLPQTTGVVQQAENLCEENSNQGGAS